MEGKEKQLRVKVKERNMICAENKKLKKKVEVLSLNMRDAERMKQDLQAVERDIGKAEIERNKCEEKCQDLNAVIGTKLNKLGALQLECNQGIRRGGFMLKLTLKRVRLDAEMGFFWCSHEGCCLVADRAVWLLTLALKHVFFGAEIETEMGAFWY